MNEAQERGALEELLKNGRETEWLERPDTSEARGKIVMWLQSVTPDDYSDKLKIAGFLDHPYGTSEDGVLEACKTCMYYEMHRQFCDLPELKVPVKPEWSCRLWRI